MSRATRCGLSLVLTGMMLALTMPAQAAGHVSAKDGSLSVPSSKRHACYGRVSGGGTFFREPDASYGGPVSNGGGFAAVAYGPTTEEDLDTTWLIDLGFGCGWSFSRQSGSIKDGFVSQPTGGLRVEFGTTIRGPSGFFAVPPTPLIPDDPIIADLHSHSLMANFYWDFRRHGNFHPYVGVGIGATRLELDSVRVVNGTTLNLQGDEQWNFSWAVMAGVGMELRQGVMLDLAYRFIDMGDFSLTSPTGLGCAGCATSRLDIDNIYAHEIMLGLRFDLGHLGLGGRRH